MHSGPCSAAAAPNSLLSQLLLLHYSLVRYTTLHRMAVGGGVRGQRRRGRRRGERMDIHTAKIGAQLQPRSSVAAARRLSRHLSPWPGPIRLPSEELKGSSTNHNSSSFPFTSNQRSSIPNCLRLEASASSVSFQSPQFTDVGGELRSHRDSIPRVRSDLEAITEHSWSDSDGFLD